MKEEKIKIAIIGKGNVGTHLYTAFSPYAETTLVDSRTLGNLPEHCDVILISVSDRAIGDVAEKLKGKARIVAHTSGSVPMEILSDTGNAYGVFYPLQTFTKGVNLDYSEIPFFIEGDNAETCAVLQAIAGLLGAKSFKADSSRRRKLHLASVFACNFANNLVAVADELLQEEGMDYKVVLPLLKQTVSKLSRLTPEEAQTGPAVRGDRPVIDAHLEMLAERPEYHAVYSIMTRNIEKIKARKEKRNECN